MKLLQSLIIIISVVLLTIVSVILLKHKRKDKFCKNIISKIKNSSNIIKSSLFSLVDGVLHFQKLIIVPSNLKVKLLKSFNDGPTMSHQGMDRTYEKLHRHYWWPNMKKDMENYVSSCDIFNKCKIRSHKLYGKILPRPIPSKP